VGGGQGRTFGSARRPRICAIARRANPTSPMASRSSSGPAPRRYAWRGHIRHAGALDTQHPLHLRRSRSKPPWLRVTTLLAAATCPATGSKPPPAPPALSTWAAAAGGRRSCREPGLLGKGNATPRSPRRADSHRRLHPQTSRRTGATTPARHRLLFNSGRQVESGSASHSDTLNEGALLKTRSGQSGRSHHSTTFTPRGRRRHAPRHHPGLAARPTCGPSSTNPSAAPTPQHARGKNTRPC